MLGEVPPGPFATGPWLNGVDIMSWPCDAAATAVSATGAGPGVDPFWGWSPMVQPYHEEIERLQQQVEDLKMWKMQAELSMRAYHQASMESGFQWQPPQLPPDVNPADEFTEARSTAASSVSGISASEWLAPRSSPRSTASHSSLPLPIRLPLGPEPAPPHRIAGIKAPDTSDGLGMLPPGLTLSRAACLSVGSAEDESESVATTAATSLYGCSLSTESTAPSAKTTMSNPPSPVDSSAAMSEAPPGMWIGPVQVAGTASVRAEWRIEDLRARLQACMGRPLVSPPFAVCGLPNLRLMVFPDAREAVKSVRSRERKGLYAAMVKKGPLHGALKLKADCLPFPTVLSFNLTVGGARKGPFTFDFSEQAIHGCDDFSVDWLRQVDEGTDNLRVGVEILEIRENRGLNPTVREGLSAQELYSMALQQLELSQACETPEGWAASEAAGEAGSARVRGKPLLHSR